MLDANILFDKGWRSNMIDDLALEYNLSEEEKKETEEKLKEKEGQEYVSCLDCKHMVLDEKNNFACTQSDGTCLFNMENAGPRSEKPLYTDAVKMEIGNILFGHSRGKCPVVPRTAMQDIFVRFLEETGFDSYGILMNRTMKKPDVIGFENDVFAVRPYYWGDDEEIEALPNFEFKPEKIEIRWYKYPFRDSYSNVKLNTVKLREILDKCKASINQSGADKNNDRKEH